MSTPALKPLPSAARITTRTSRSSPSALIVSASSNQPATGSALTGGLLITTSAMPSATSTLRNSRGFLMVSQVSFPGVAPEIDLTGRVVLVTGGTRGGGRGIAARFVAAGGGGGGGGGPPAARFVAAGADVVVCGRHAASDSSGLFVEADVRQPDDVDQLVATVVERFG